jgi:hypothetical protein
MSPDVADDIVLVEGEPSMRLISSPPAEPTHSEGSSEVQGVTENPHRFNSSPPHAAPSYRSMAFNMPIRPRPDFPSSSAIPGGLPQEPGCYNISDFDDFNGSSYMSMAQRRAMCHFPLEHRLSGPQMAYESFDSQTNKRRSMTPRMQHPSVTVSPHVPFSNSALKKSSAPSSSTGKNEACATREQLSNRVFSRLHHRQ